MSGLEALRKAQSLIAGNADLRSGDRSKEILALLADVERELVTLSAGSHLRRVSKKGGSVSYMVEKLVGDGMVLTERRVGTTAHPMRCPVNIYEAAATVLSAADHALAVEQIISSIDSAVGVEPAAFQVRLAVRCWMSVDPPLVERIRAKYRPVEKPGFLRRAKKLWRNLEI